MRQILAPKGEFGGFGIVGGVLMTPAVLAAVLASFDHSGCACHARDASVLFSSLCGSSGCDSGLLPGKFDFFWVFWGVLTRSDLFSDLRESLTTLCACLTRPLGF